MSKNNLDAFSLIKLRQLASLTGLKYSYLRNNLKGSYGSWTDQDRRKIFNTMHKEVSKAAAVLGFSYEGRPIVPKD